MSGTNHQSRSWRTQLGGPQKTSTIFLQQLYTQYYTVRAQGGTQRCDSMMSQDGICHTEPIIMSLHVNFKIYYYGTKLRMIPGAEYELRIWYYTKFYTIVFFLINKSKNDFFTPLNA